MIPTLPLHFLILIVLILNGIGIFSCATIRPPGYQEERTPQTLSSTKQAESSKAIPAASKEERVVSPLPAAEQQPIHSSKSPQAKETKAPFFIAKKHLEHYLKMGPQAFIQKLEVRPSFRRGRFWGWRLLAYNGPGPLQVGDIVTSINGHSIERPEQFMFVWNNLKNCSELTVDVVRGRRNIFLRYVIQ